MKKIFYIVSVLLFFFIFELNTDALSKEYEICKKGCEYHNINEVYWDIESLYGNYDITINFKDNERYSFYDFDGYTPTSFAYDVVNKRMAKEGYSDLTEYIFVKLDSCSNLYTEDEEIEDCAAMSIYPLTILAVEMDDEEISDFCEENYKHYGYTNYSDEEKYNRCVEDLKDVHSDSLVNSLTIPVKTIPEIDSNDLKKASIVSYGLYGLSSVKPHNITINANGATLSGSPKELMDSYKEAMIKVFPEYSSILDSITILDHELFDRLFYQSFINNNVTINNAVFEGSFYALSPYNHNEINVNNSDFTKSNIITFGDLTMNINNSKISNIYDIGNSAYDYNSDSTSHFYDGFFTSSKEPTIYVNNNCTFTGGVAKRNDEFIQESYENMMKFYEDLFNVDDNMILLLRNIMGEEDFNSVLPPENFGNVPVVTSVRKPSTPNYRKNSWCSYYYSIKDYSKKEKIYHSFYAGGSDCNEEYYNQMMEAYNQDMELYNTNLTYYNYWTEEEKYKEYSEYVNKLYNKMKESKNYNNAYLPMVSYFCETMLTALENGLLLDIDEFYNSGNALNYVSKALGTTDITSSVYDGISKVFDGMSYLIWQTEENPSILYSGGTSKILFTHDAEDKTELSNNKLKVSKYFNFDKYEYDNINWTYSNPGIIEIKGENIKPLKVGSTVATGSLNKDNVIRIKMDVTEDMINPKTGVLDYKIGITAILILSVIMYMVFKTKYSNMKV